MSKAQRTCSALARSERWFLALVVLGFAARVAQWLWIAVVDGRVLTIYSVPVTGARCPPPYSLIGASCRFYQYSGVESLWIHSAVGAVLLALLIWCVRRARRAVTIVVLLAMATDTATMWSSSVLILAAGLLVVVPIAQQARGCT